MKIKVIIFSVIMGLFILYSPFELTRVILMGIDTEINYVFYAPDFWVAEIFAIWIGYIFTGILLWRVLHMEAKEVICFYCGMVESKCICHYRRIEKEVTRIIGNDPSPESIRKMYKHIMDNIKDEGVIAVCPIKIDKIHCTNCYFLENGKCDYENAIKCYEKDG